MLDFRDWIERDEIDVLLASLPASRWRRATARC